MSFVVARGDPNGFLVHRLVAELQRAKRASEASWVRKIGNPSSRENLVMTSAYDRASERASERPHRLGGRGKGVLRYSSRSPIRETKECHLSLAVFCLEKSEKHTFLFAMSTNDRSQQTFQGRVKLKQNLKENSREQGLTDKDVATKFAKE